MSAKQTMKITRFVPAITFSLACLFPAMSIAQVKVVVIPMGGEDTISHPVATTFTNSIGMQFNILPAGSFTMGSPVSEPGRDNGEVEHTVALSKAFRLQVTEVTNAHWNEVIVDSTIGVNPSIRNTGDEYPIHFVYWYDAVFFANRLSSVEGRSTCYAFVGVTGTPGSNLAIDSVTMNASCTAYQPKPSGNMQQGQRRPRLTQIQSTLMIRMMKQGRVLMAT